MTNVSRSCWFYCLILNAVPQALLFYQEFIESRGHFCDFYPKFHCELNFIEFFWGAVERYLRKNCDYTFDTLKANLPKAMAPISIKTIQQWEHHTVRWRGAYGAGLGVKEAQFKVK